MDALLKKAQQKAAKLQQNASSLAKDVITQARLDSGQVAGVREMTFARGQFGFTLDGATVDSVDRDGQAAKIGLQVGDRLIAVDGYSLPAMRKDPGPEDISKFRDTVRQWLADMARPGNLTFVSPQPQEPPSQPQPVAVASAQVGEEDAAILAAEAALSGLVSATPRGDTRSPRPLPLEEPGSSELVLDTAALPERARAELHRLQDLTIRLQCELEEVQAECRELRQLHGGDLDEGGSRGGAAGEPDEDESVAAGAAAAAAQSLAEATIRNLQEQLAAARAEFDVARRQSANLSAQLAAEAVRTEVLRRALAESEDVALDSSAEREQVLVAEVGRLRAELHTTEAEAAAARRQADDNMQHSERRISELEGDLARRARRDTELSSLKTAAERERDEVAAERNASVDTALRLQRELDDADAARQRLTTEQKGLHCQLQEALRELQQLRSKARARLVDGEEDDEEEAPADVGVDEAAAEPLVGDADAEEALQAERFCTTADQVNSLQDQIRYLEQRCARLQKKLDARPIVYQHSRASGGEAANHVAQQSPILCCESQLRSACPVGTSLTEVVLQTLDRRLRSLAERLQTSAMIRWMFGAHLLVVYSLASLAWGRSEQTSLDPSMT